jgi:cyanophycin synthetase
LTATAPQSVVRLTVVDNLPPQFFVSLFKDAIELLQHRLSTPPSDEAADALFTEVDQRLVQRFHRAVQFSGSSRTTCRLAFDRNVPFRHLGCGLMLLGCGANSTMVRGAAVARDSALGAEVCTNKHLTASILGTGGLPVPEQIAVASLEGALAAAKKLGWPVVVKPMDREQSVGVTTDVTGRKKLDRAYAAARGASRHVLLENHLPGTCHRIMVADGALVYAVARLPKGVTGTGRDSVARLVELANEHG